MMNNSVTILGAGMVGVCSALNLIKKGYSVTLVDREAPGKATSYGNAGLINRGSIFPLGLKDIIQHLPNAVLKRYPNVHVHLHHLPHYWNWVWHMVTHSRAANYEHTVLALNNLFEFALEELCTRQKKVN